MTRLDARTWMEILSTTECWGLLGTCAIGRLAVSTPQGPEIYPVNIAVDGESVVFRTDPGSKLTAIAADPRVALEADFVDHDASDGWSVLVVGRLVELSGGELVAARRLPLAPWTIGDKQRWFRLVPRRVTGRRVGVRASRAEG